MSDNLIEQFLASYRASGARDYRARMLEWAYAIEQFYLEHHNRELTDRLTTEFIIEFKLSAREREEVYIWLANRLLAIGAFSSAQIVASNLYEGPESVISLFGIDQTRDIVEACQAADMGSTRAPLNDKLRLAAVCTEIPILYITTRERDASGHLNPYLRYGGRQSSGPFFGTAVISVPKNRRRGIIDRDRRKEESEVRSQISRSKYYVILSMTDEKEPNVFDKQLAKAVGQQTLFVFVHGWGVSLASALLHTAQIMADVELKGGGLCLSWPSTGLYYKIANSITEPVIETFAKELRRAMNAAQAQRVCLVGHSLGCRLLLRVLNHMQSQTNMPKIDHAVFASADVPIKEFNETCAKLKSKVGRLTAYASTADVALSLALVAPANAPRAGLHAAEIARHVEAIDTTFGSNLSSDRWKHSDFSEAAYEDLRQLLHSAGKSGKRIFLEQVTPLGKDAYWEFYSP